MGRYIVIAFNTDGELKHKCVICDFPLDDVFPDDYPEEFKFCCKCLGWAKFLTEPNTFKGTLFTPRLIRIYNAIRLT